MVAAPRGHRLWAQAVVNWGDRGSPRYWNSICEINYLFFSFPIFMYHFSHAEKNYSHEGFFFLIDAFFLSFSLSNRILTLCSYLHVTTDFQYKFEQVCFPGCERNGEHAVAPRIFPMSSTNVVLLCDVCFCMIGKIVFPVSGFNWSMST